MINSTTFLRKIATFFILIMLYSTVSFSSDDIFYCVDIKTESPTPESPIRVFNLVVSEIAENTYSLHGTNRNKTGDVIGSVTGSATVLKSNIIIDISTGSKNSFSNYQLDLAVDSGRGSYWSMTSTPGGNSPLIFKSGMAALKDCNDKISDFSPGCNVKGCDLDVDGYYSPSDCKDSDPDIHPGAVEICGDGIDQNCDGKDLECYGSTEFDKDGDGSNFIADCNDNNPDIHPGADEICENSFDDNCDGHVNENCNVVIDPNETDDDGDGVTEKQGDCNDEDATIYPGATDICGDDINQDCSTGGDQCPSFTDIEDKTITSSDGLLMWERTEDGVTPRWKSAVDFCENSFHAGLSDWRLPNKEELESLIDNSQSPMINSNFEVKTDKLYWSATNENETYAWGLDFATGEAKLELTGRGQYSRCVRNAK